MNDDKNSSSLNNSKKKKRHSSTTNSTNKNDRSTTIINNNNNNINEPFTSHQYRHDGTNLNNTLPFNTEGHSIYNESRIIDTPTNNISINSLTNSVLSTEAKNNMGIFSQNNVNTMMNNIIQQILSTLSAQQERMNNMQQQGAFTPINVSSSMNASLDGKEDQQKIQTCNGTNVNHHQQKQETPPSSSYSMNNQLVDGSNYSSFNNGSGDVGQASSSLTSSSRSSSNNTTNSSLSITSSSSSSFVNNNDSKKYTFSSGNTSSTLEFINALSTAPTNQSSATTSSNVQHEYNDQLSDGGISQLFDECAHSTFNIDPSSSSLTTKSTSEFNLEDYQDLFSDRSAVREFGDDTSCNRQEPNVTQSQTNNNNNRQQSNQALDNINEPMLWGMLRQMLTSDNEGAMSGQYSLTISNPSNGSGSSNDSNSPYIQNQQMSTANTSSTPTIQSSTINFGQNNFQGRAPQGFNNNAQPPNNVRNLISTLFDNLNNGRQMHPGLKITSVIPDFKLEEEEEDESEDDNQLSNHPGDPPTIDSTKQILGSIRKTLSNKSNPAPNQFQRHGFQQRPSDGFIKWLSEHSTSHNREQDNEVEEPHQPTTTNNMSHFKFYNEMLSDKNNALHSHPPNFSNSESSINSTKVTKDQPSNASNNAVNMKPLKIFQHDPHKPKKKKDLQNGEHILNFQSPQSSDNTTTTTTSSESSDKNAKRKRKEGKDSKKKTTHNNSSKKKKE